MHSCVYEGWVRHRRFEPVAHAFRYRVWMVYLDLDELQQVFRKRLLWSTRRWNVAHFRREDYGPNPQQPLGAAMLDLAHRRLGQRPSGPIRLLTQLRMFGFVFNPVSFYFMYDGPEHLQAVIAEVNNTPWGERHHYLLRAEDWSGGADSPAIAKEFHVSPFMPMDVRYRWRISPPDESLAIHIDNWQEQKFFDVTLNLQRRPITTANLARVLLRYPFSTYAVVARIYGQALRLWAKGCPFFAHPKHAPSPAVDDQAEAYPSEPARAGAVTKRTHQHEEC